MAGHSTAQEGIPSRHKKRHNFTTQRKQFRQANLHQERCTVFAPIMNMKFSLEWVQCRSPSAKTTTLKNMCPSEAACGVQLCTRCTTGGSPQEPFPVENRGFPSHLLLYVF